MFDLAIRSFWVDEVRLWGGWRTKDATPDPILAFGDACRSLGVDGGTIGLELGHSQRIAMSQREFGRFQITLSKARLVDASSLLWDLRTLKSPLEVEALRIACDATNKAFERGFNAIYPGMTEREFSGIILAEMSSNTREIPGFITIRSGELKYGWVNVKHFVKPMDTGDLIIVDVGANYKYYWSDFMRMACIGEPSREQRRYFEATLASQRAGVEAIKPGASARGF